MKKNVIKFTEEAYSDAHVVVINTTLHDYQLAYYINNILGINLCRKGNIQHSNDYYPYFFYIEEKNDSTYSLMSMVSFDEKARIPFKQPLDFILIIKKIDHIGIDNIIKSLREIPKITFIYNLKTKESIVMELLSIIELKECEMLPNRRMTNLSDEFDYEDDYYEEDEDDDEPLEMIIIKN